MTLDHSAPACPRTAATPAASAATLEVVQVFDTFLLARRSAILDGAIPLRAAQGCKPFLNGNEAGLHLQFREPARIDRDGDTADLRLSEEGHEQATHDYHQRVDRLVRDGYLPRDGYWHREIRDGFVRQDGALLKIWTGLLVRPERGAWWQVATSFNRRCMADVVEYVISDSSAFVPLILEVRIDSLRHAETWLDTELASLTPLRPGTRVAIHSLTAKPEVGRSFLDFYSAEYLARRGDAKYAGAYRKLDLSAVETGKGDALCELVYSGDQKIAASVDHLQRFAGAGGFTAEDPGGGRLEFGVLHAAFDIRGRWDGLNLRDLTDPPADQMTQVTGEWSRLYGEDTVERALFWISYLLPQLGPTRGEPYLTLAPWVLTRSTPGWSILLDGMSFQNVDGLRGVIATDVFPMTATQYQFYAPGDFHIPAGAPIGRVIPFPRTMLQAEFRRPEF